MFHKLSHIIVIFITFIILSSPESIYAHFIETASGISINMHIDPDDNPIIGEPADFYFQITGDNEIDHQNCDCTARIIYNGDPIFTGSLFAENQNPGFDDPSFSFTFPEKGLYVVRIVGRPLNGGNFESFTIDYPLRVTRESENSSALSSIFSNIPVSIEILKTVGVYLLTIIVVVLAAKKMMNKKRKI